MGAIYWFQSRMTPEQLQAGQIEKIVLYHPGDLAAVTQWARQNKLGSPGVRYTIAPIPTSQQYSDVVILGVQINLGGRSPSFTGAVVSAQHVNGGTPVNEPIAQPGQNNPGGPVDPNSHFQKLADADLPLDIDGSDLYGGPPDPSQATFMDFYPLSRMGRPRQETR